MQTAGTLSPVRSGPPSRAAGWVLLALALTACSGREEAQEAAPPDEVAEEAEDDRVTLRGELYQTSAPVGSITMLSREDGKSAVRLLGEREEELRRLTGARVEVAGKRSEAYPREEVRVERYEILEIDGQRPHVGTVRVEDGEVWLHRNDERWRVRGAPPALRDREGAKIWVVGERERAEIRLASYGVIRP